jgi:hypothetical protein
MAKKKQIQENVLEEFTTLRTRRKTLEERWLRAFKRLYMFESLTKEELEDIALGVMSKIRVPIELQAIETKLPRIVNTIFAENPIVSAIPNTARSVDYAPTLSRLVNMYIEQRLYSPFCYSAFQALYAGTGCTFLGWQFPKVVQGNIVEGPRFEFSDIFNTYVPDGYLEQDEIDVVYRRLLKKKEYLLKVAGKMGYDIKAIEEAFEKPQDITIQKDSIYMERLNVLGINVGQKDIITAFDAKSEVKIGELVERWEKDILTTTLNGVVIKRSKHMYPNFVPFFFLKNYRNDVMFYGLGEIDIMGDLPDYQREIKDLRIEVLRRVAHPAALVSRTAMISEEDLVTKPFQVINTSDMEGYKEVQRPDVKRILVEEEFIAKQGLEDATGIYSYIKGGEAPRAETATTALAMQEAGMERINSVIFYNCKTYFTDICYRLTTLLQEKLDNKIFMQWQDPYSMEYKYSTIDKNDILCEVTWEISAFKIKSIADVNIQQSFMVCYDKLIQSPNINRYYLDKSLMELFGIKNIPQMLIPDGPAEILSYIREHPDLVPAVLNHIRQIMPRLIQKQQGPPSATAGMASMPGGTNTAGMNLPMPTGPNAGNMGGGQFVR